MVEQFGIFVAYRCCVGLLRLHYYGSNILFGCYVAAYRCAIIIQIMCYAVKVASPLTIFGISKSDFQRDQKKIPLLVRTFRSDLSTGFGKQFSYTSRRNFQIRTLLNIFFDPFFQGVLCLNLNGWLFIFQVVAGENGILSIVVLKW